MPVSESQVLRILAQRLKELRGAKRWSQQELAERASMQRSYIADLERGHRNASLRTLVKVSNALGVAVASLLEEGRKGKKRATPKQ